MLVLWPDSIKTIAAGALRMGAAAVLELNAP